MSTKKTATKKVARKRTSKKDIEASSVETTAESAPVSTENVEAAPKKRTPRKTTPKTVTEESTATVPAVAPEQSDRKEPIQGVRDARAQKGDDDTAKPEAQNAGVQKPQNDDNASDGDQNQQGKGRNRRGRRNRNNKGDQQQQAQQVQAPKIDAKELSKRAWKIFLSEVSEEGLALIGDKEGRELSKKSFRLAEIFLEEQGRRRTPKPQPQQRRRQNQDAVSPAAEEVKPTEEVKASTEAAKVEAPKVEVASAPKNEE
ncbi:MAG: hypothetical protein ABGY95_01655 [Rubritalea sp.]|uniref:hypothetical protein n=1 Tax=Rubritalea sp. TaxID=2109375 RepID=UPI003242580A